MSRLFVVVAMLALAGCKSTPPPPPPLPSPQLDHTDGVRNPVQVSWIEVKRDATSAELVARVKRLAPLPFALEVSVTLPPGATLTKGRARFTLPVNLEGATHDEAIAIAFEKTPAADVELAADGETIDMGVHARVPYRFGRPAPVSEVVAPTGPDLKLGDRNLGPSIPLTP